MPFVGDSGERQRSEFGFTYPWEGGPRKRKSGDILGNVKSEQQNSLIRKIDSERNELSVTFGDGIYLSSWPKCKIFRAIRSSEIKHTELSVNSGAFGLVVRM